MARPLNPENGRYDIRAEPDELRKWADAAQADGRSLLQWIKAELNAAAARSRRKRRVQ